MHVDEKQKLTARALHLLFHRDTRWLSDVRCSTNILAQMFLQAGCHVSYMQGIAHLGRILVHRKYRGSWIQGPRYDRDAWVFTPLSLVPFMRRGIFAHPWAAEACYHFCLPSIRTLVRRSGFDDPDVIWTAKPGSSGLGRLFKKALLIHQVVDYYPAFGGTYTQEIERRDYERADHIFSTGHALAAYLVDELGIPPTKITTLGQGVFTERYQQEFPEPAELHGLPHPRAIWVGVLSKGDAALFSAAAAYLKRLGGSLILIGPSTDWAFGLSQKSDNVYLLGPKMPELVPAYLCHSDLGLMLYDCNRPGIYRGQHPLKLYEYAAAGLSILSTPHAEYQYIAPPVIQLRGVDEIASAIDLALAERGTWSSRARQFAEQYSWTVKFKQVESIIANLLGEVRTA